MVVARSPGLFEEVLSRQMTFLHAGCEEQVVLVSTSVHQILMTAWFICSKLGATKKSLMPVPWK